MFRFVFFLIWCNLLSYYQIGTFYTELLYSTVLKFPEKVVSNSFFRIEGMELEIRVRVVLGSRVVFVFVCCWGSRAMFVLG